MIYSVKFDQFVKSITAISCLIFLSIAVIFYLKYMDSSGIFKIICIAASLLIILIPFILYAYTPKNLYFDKSKKQLIINKRLFPKEISLQGSLKVKSVKFLPNTMTLSTKGAFGYLGTTMDGYKSYVTDKNNVIAIDNGKEKVLVSCKNSQVLKEELNKLLN